MSIESEINNKRTPLPQRVKCKTLIGIRERKGIVFSQPNPRQLLLAMLGSTDMIEFVI